jgi:hypothetical protein
VGTANNNQTVRVLDGTYVLDRPLEVSTDDLRADVFAIVRGPDGLMMMRRNDSAVNEPGAETWAALWNGDNAHDLDAVGMLSALLAPLAAAGIGIWNASSWDGDVILVPSDRLDDAVEALVAAGHQVLR